MHRKTVTKSPFASIQYVEHCTNKQQVAQSSVLKAADNSSLSGITSSPLRQLPGKWECIVGSHWRHSWQQTPGPI